MKSIIIVSILLSGFIVNNVFSQKQETDSISYLFVGHCFQDNTMGSKMDFRIESLDKSPYKGIWLGGDVCSEAMLNYSTVQYIDSVVDLGNLETHWALGNHDAREGNWEWYNEFTGRDTYFAYSSNKITRIVMNTNLVPTNCEMIEDQYEIISNVCDTIQDSKYLILLMHHGIWKDIPGLIQPNLYANSNLVYWSATCDSVNTPFVNTIYAKLKQVNNRGTQVICVLGDMGGYKKTFSSISDDGIWFLGCGLNHNEPDDEVLIFNYNITNEFLDWQFHNLDSLYLMNTPIE